MRPATSSFWLSGSDLIHARPVLRHSARDGVFVALSVAHAAVLVVAASVPVIAIGLWWNANTIAHNFLHLPFFRSRRVNRVYSMYLSLLLGVPQSLWRRRHLMHHAGRDHALRWTRAMSVEAALIGVLWAAIIWVSPAFFLTVYVPGTIAGLGLCWLQGHYEHARGATSHYGRIYNWLFFNDGYHVEHHDRPNEHWTRVGLVRRPDARASVWPPVLRWLDAFSLEGLERLVLRSPRLQRFVLATHERAFRRLLPEAGVVRRVTIVGGGLFPRTALVLRRLLPEAEVTIVDARADHLDSARRFLGDHVSLVHRTFDCSANPGTADAGAADADLLVIPLSLHGNRRAIYASPPAPAVLIHDWIWSRRAPGAVVSWLLLKRLNLVRSSSHAA